MGRLWRRLGHDRRVLVLAILAGLPGIVVALGFIWLEPLAPRVQWTVTFALAGSWLGLAAAVREQVVRPLGTLANMLAALREGDFSIRARVGDADDALSLAFLEVNNLEEILREQRLGAVEAAETLRKVLEEIDVVVLAFDPDGTLQLVNRAGERLLGQPAERRSSAAEHVDRQDHAAHVDAGAGEVVLHGEVEEVVGGSDGLHGCLLVLVAG